MKNKSGLSITNGYKIVLGESPPGGSESREPEKLCLDRGSDFYNKTLKPLLKEYETELYSTYTDLKAVFIERFKRTLLNIFSKAMFINGDGDWLGIINDAVVTYNNKVHSSINLTPVDASNNPDKIKYTFSFKNNEAKHKVGEYVRNADKRNIF